MTKKEFIGYLDHAIDDYASEKVLSGTFEVDTAQYLAEKEYNELLPEGNITPNHHLLNILTDEGKKVGEFWYHFDPENQKKIAYVYDISIFPEHQDQGYGSCAMLLFEEEAKKLGAKRLDLHVFGHNKVAWHLYHNMGYIVTDINMSKNLEKAE
jgi:ribosomal protein S18 acetylase RimI-like enzyme